MAGRLKRKQQQVKAPYLSYRLYCCGNSCHRSLEVEHAVPAEAPKVNLWHPYGYTIQHPPSGMCKEETALLSPFCPHSALRDHWLAHHSPVTAQQKSGFLLILIGLQPFPSPDSLGHLPHDEGFFIRKDTSLEKHPQDMPFLLSWLAMQATFSISC